MASDSKDGAIDGPSGVHIKRGTMNLLLEELGEERKARLKLQIARDEQEHVERLATEKRQERLQGALVKVVLSLVAGLLGVVGVYVTVGFPGGAEVGAANEPQAEATP